MSPAFIRELVRRATLAAVETGEPPVLTGDLLGDALTDLLEHSAPIVRTMLGATYDPDLDMTFDEGPSPWS